MERLLNNFIMPLWLFIFLKSLTVKQSIEKGGTCRLIPGLLNLSYEGRSIYRSKVLNNLFLTLSCWFSNNLHSWTIGICRPVLGCDKYCWLLQKQFSSMAQLIRHQLLSLNQLGLLMIFCLPPIMHNTTVLIPKYASKIANLRYDCPVIS